MLNYQRVYVIRFYFTWRSYQIIHQTPEETETSENGSNKKISIKHTCSLIPIPFFDTHASIWIQMDMENMPEM